MATTTVIPCGSDGIWEFLINRRHQGLATNALLQNGKADGWLFPINRGHQGLATFVDGIEQPRPIDAGFQSIGVTKDWRRFIITRAMQCFICFQSIGVTKDWRLLAEPCTPPPQLPVFPINRGHQGLATLNPSIIRFAACARFPINRGHQGLATSKSRGLNHG